MKRIFDLSGITPMESLMEYIQKNKPNLEFQMVEGIIVDHSIYEEYLQQEKALGVEPGDLEVTLYGYPVYWRMRV